jgi:CRISPR-associated endonuclease/helicase Cas3
MTTPKFLPAKKAGPWGRGPSLAEHLHDTERAAAEVFRLDRRWGQSLCRFFQIPHAEAERFLLGVRVAGLFHDLGKANADFCAMMTGGNQKQVLRHEHLSATLLHLPEIQAWLRQAPQLDHDVVTAAVLSHHIQASEDGEHKWMEPRREALSLSLFLTHPDVSLTLERVRGLLELGPCPAIPSSSLKFANGLSSPWKEAYAAGRLAAVRFRRALRADPARQRMMAATKVALIVADSVASGLVREGHDLPQWIEHVVHSPSLTAEEINDAIIEPRLKVIRRAHPGAGLRDFQRALAGQPARCLFLAACGSGKTLAAWAWAREQTKTQQLGRVVFLYPTRGTATEGFRDYVAWAPEGEAALVQGTAGYELEAMASNPPESLDGKDPTAAEGDARLFALGLWSRRYFSATADQFLAFLEHSYRSICLVPVLADAALIIDEVHSYDDSMFRSLLALLKDFRGPVLCMTATLTPSRREQLEACGLSVFPRSEDRAALEELEKAECAPRYKLQLRESIEGMPQLVVDALAQGQRVLWVVNTVARCQHIAEALASLVEQEVITYHSRFRLCDRKDRHAETVQAFQGASAPAIAITTQVCEMSLDLDADLLITEVAPISSLVQRFGRANRHLAHGAEFRGALIAYPATSPLPYEREELALAADFLSGLQGRDLSQRDLSNALERHAREEATPREGTSLFDSGYYAVPGSFRDTDDGAQSILDSDIEVVRSLIAQRKPWDGYVLPAPRRLTTEPPPGLPPYLRISAGARYTTARGLDVTAKERD